jgi:pilus assembly protein CpaE
VLAVCVVGDISEKRAEVVAVLKAISDPKVEVIERAISQLSNNGDDRHNGSRAEPAVLMVILSENDDLPFTCLQRLAESSPRPPLIAVLPEKARAPMLRRAVRAGAEEVLFSPLKPDDLTRVLIKVIEARRRTQRHQGGIVCSVTSLTGGVGVTSVAVNLALAIRRTLDRRVVLVDFDLQKGTVATILNLSSEHSILSLVDQDRAPDSLRVEAALAKHDSGVYVLAAPKRVEDGDLVADATVEITLDLMRAMFDVVIVDTGNHVSEQTVAAWEGSDQVLYVIDQSIASARRASRFVDLFDRLQFASVELRFILNRYVSGYPVTEDQIAAVVARPFFGKLQRDDKTMERVDLSGRDLWQVAPGSPLAGTFDELSRLIVAPAAESSEPRAGTIMSRLASALPWRSRGFANETH